MVSTVLLRPQNYMSQWKSRVFLAKFIKLMEFIRDELHVILKLIEFTLQYHNYFN
jgi:hypothetical protein